eukprot:scaffold168607_cov37-Tisochrysis_lutea.AAC.2
MALQGGITRRLSGEAPGEGACETAPPVRRAAPSGGKESDGASEELLGRRARSLSWRYLVRMDWYSLSSLRSTSVGLQPWVASHALSHSRSCTLHALKAASAFSLSVFPPP